MLLTPKVNASIGVCLCAARRRIEGAAVPGIDERVTSARFMISFESLRIFTQLIVRRGGREDNGDKKTPTVSVHQTLKAQQPQPQTQ